MKDHQLEWKESYSTGIKEIDRQHKELFSLVNRLLDISSNNGKLDVENHYSGIMEGIKTLENHFNTEEDWMIKNKYLDYEKHKRKHERMRNDIMEIINEIQAGKHTLGLINLALYIREWFLKHINEMDIPMGGVIK